MDMPARATNGARTVPAHARWTHLEWYKSMKTETIPAVFLACCLQFFGVEGQALTLSYSNVDPSGIGDTMVGGNPARLIAVTEDDLVLRADTSLTINVSFKNGQALVVSPAATPGIELINLAFVSPSVNQSSPFGVDGPTGTVTVAAANDFIPGSGIPAAFASVFTPNSPLASADVILLQRIGNLTDSGYTLQSLQYQIDIPADFTEFPVSGINLLVTGSAFNVVPLPAAFPLLLTALLVTAGVRGRRAGS